MFTHPASRTLNLIIGVALLFSTELFASGRFIDCVRKKFFNIEKNTSAAPIEVILNRTPTTNELSAIQEAVQISPTGYYTPTETQQINQNLKNAGFQDGEISALRRHRALGKGTIAWPEAIPEKIEVFQASLLQPSRTLLEKIKNNESFSYIVDSGGHVSLVEGLQTFPPNRLWTTPKSIINEAGALTYNKSLRKFELKASYGIDLTPEEELQIIAQIQKKNPDFKFSHSSDPTRTHARLVNCMEVMAKQNAGNQFWSRFLSDSAITTAAVLANEAQGAHRFDDPNKRTILIVDYLGIAAGAGVANQLGKSLVAGGAGFWKSMTVRAGAGAALTVAQGGTVQGLLGHTHDDPAKKLVYFNLAHSAARIPINHLVDKALIDWLPLVAFNACLANPKLSFLVSPNAIRLVERTGSAYLYYATRKQFIDE